MFNKPIIEDIEDKEHPIVSRIKYTEYVSSLLSCGGLHIPFYNDILTKILNESPKVSFKNNMVKYKFDIIPGVTMVGYKRPTDGQYYTKVKGNYLLTGLSKETEGMDTIPLALQEMFSKCCLLTIGDSHRTTGEMVNISISERHSRDEQVEIWNKAEQFGKKDKTYKSVPYFSKNFRVDINYPERKGTKIINFFMDLNTLKTLIQFIAYSSRDWSHSVLTKLEDEYIYLHKCSKLIPTIPVSLKRITNMHNKIYRNRILVDAVEDIESGFLKQEEFDYPFTSIKKVDEMGIVFCVDDAGSYTIVDRFMISEPQPPTEKEMKSYKHFIDERINTYCLSFRMFADSEPVDRLVFVDEDVMELTLEKFYTSTYEELGKYLNDPKMESGEVIINNSNACYTTYRLIGEKRKLLEYNDKQKVEITLKEEKEKEKRIKEREELIKQQSLDRHEIQDALNPGYQTTIEKVLDFLTYNGINGQESKSIKFEEPEPFEFIFSGVDPEPIKLTDEYELTVVEEPIEYSDNMICVANPFEPIEGNGNGSGNYDREFHERRVKTLRALQGKVNAKIIYKSGKIYDSRLRITVDERVVAEPVKGDTAALIFEYNDVEDCIINNKLIQLAQIPHKRKYHTKKGIERLVNDFEYVEVNDLV